MWTFERVSTEKFFFSWARPTNGPKHFMGAPAQVQRRDYVNCRAISLSAPLIVPVNCWASRGVPDRREIRREKGQQRPKLSPMGAKRLFLYCLANNSFSPPFNGTSILRPPPPDSRTNSISHLRKKEEEEDKRAENDTKREIYSIWPKKVGWPTFAYTKNNRRFSREKRGKNRWQGRGKKEKKIVGRLFSGVGKNKGGWKRSLSAV